MCYKDEHQLVLVATNAQVNFTESSPPKRVRQTTKFFGFLLQVRGPLGAQRTPWQGTLGSPRDPMGGDPWEPKGPHGKGPLGAQGTPWEGTLESPRDPMGGEPLKPKGSHGRGPVGAQGTPWEGTLGSPRDRMGEDPSGLRDHQGSVWSQLGSPGTILEVLRDEATFQEILKS